MMLAPGPQRKLVETWQTRERPGSPQNLKKLNNQDFNHLRSYYLSKGQLFEDGTFPAHASSIGPQLLPEDTLRHITWRRPIVSCYSWWVLVALVCNRNAKISVNRQMFHFICCLLAAPMSEELCTAVLTWEGLIIVSQELCSRVGGRRCLMWHLLQECSICSPPLAILEILNACFLNNGGSRAWSLEGRCPQDSLF